MQMESKAQDGNFAKTMLADSYLSVFLDYEIRSSWWASWIGWNWGQELSGKYFTWKTSRKYARYKQSKVWERNKRLSKKRLLDLGFKIKLGV